MSIVWSLVLWLHVLSETLWVGGAAYSLAILRPSLGLLDPTARASVQLQALTRFLRLMWHIIPTVLITGWLLVWHEGGFAVIGWPINAMQVGGLLMAAVFLRLWFGPFQRARRAIRPQPALFDMIRTHVLAVVGLGAVTILMAAFSRGI